MHCSRNASTSPVLAKGGRGPPAPAPYAAPSGPAEGEGDPAGTGHGCCWEAPGEEVQAYWDMLSPPPPGFEESGGSEAAPELAATIGETPAQDGWFCCPPKRRSRRAWEQRSELGQEEVQGPDPRRPQKEREDPPAPGLQQTEGTPQGHMFQPT